MVVVLVVCVDDGERDGCARLQEEDHLSAAARRQARLRRPRKHLLDAIKRISLLRNLPPRYLAPSRDATREHRKNIS